MNPDYARLNLWFLFGTLLTVLALSGLVLRWMQRDATKRELDRSSTAFGLHASACWLALLLMLHAAVDPIWQTVDRRMVMDLSLRDIGAFYAFFAGFSVVGWLLLVRLSYFVYFWVFQERVVSGAVRLGKTGPVLTWSGMLVFLAYFAQAALGKLFMAWVPYPDLPTFD